MYRTWSYTGRTVPSPTGKLELLPHNTAMLLDLHNHNLMINLYQVRQNPGPPNSCGPSSCNYAESLKHRPASSEVGLCHLHESHRQSWNLHPGTILKGNSSSCDRYNWELELNLLTRRTWAAADSELEYCTKCHKLSESHIVTQICSFICIFLPLFWGL